uniref:Uncharacterized protein n=1 Tax=Corvus moneduloides TaxID=1196302 RepID=A0A8U7P005_CORMO
VALGGLTQKLGSWKRSVGVADRFHIDEVSKGWPASLRAVVAAVILIEESQKLTLGLPYKEILCLRKVYKTSSFL